MTQFAEVCPGCQSHDLTQPHLVPTQPVILNYRFATADAAKNIARADVTLTQCRRCGLIFNKSFDSSLVPYDARYENSQCHSPAFLDYLRQNSQRLVVSLNLTGKRILEVGCGKGFFLEMICKEAGGSGTGYDTTYEGPSRLETPSIDFHARYVSAADVTEPYDLILCRHVIEHVPEVGSFLEELRAIAVAAGNARIILETPSFEWIQEQGSFWDVFYEHCNYFGHACLKSLCERAGLEVLSQQTVFGSQYQIIEARPKQKDTASEFNGIQPSADLLAYSTAAESAKNNLLLRLDQANARKGWGIWGAGGKGVALVNQLNYPPPLFVIDSNPAKQGCVIPGSNVPIVSPEHPAIMELKVILVANPNYFSEIKLSLATLGYRNAVLSA